VSKSDEKNARVRNPPLQKAKKSTAGGDPSPEWEIVQAVVHKSEVGRLGGGSLDKKFKRT